MPVRKHIITGPDIDKLASGIYAPEVQELRQKLNQERQQNTSHTRRIARLTAATKDLEKRAKAARNTAESLRKDLATSRDTRAKLAQENARLKARLLNAGITIQEEA